MRRDHKPVTLEDVASKAGVTVMTLSRFFRTPDKVAAATRARISTAIEQLGYVGNATAARLAGNARPMIAVIVPSLDLPYVSDVFAGVAEAAEARDAAVMLSETHFAPDRQETLIETALSWQPTGVVFLGDTLSERSRRMIAANRSRFVETWAYAAEPVDLSVGISNFDASFLAATALLRHATGPVGFAARRLGYAIEQHREDGYRAAMAEAGLAPVVYAVEGEASGFAAGAELMQQIIDDGRVGSVLFAGDVIAAGALFEAQRRQVAVPGAVAICGIGNYDIGKHCVPSLSTVALPSVDIGRRAVEACFGQQSSLCLPATLVARQSARI